MKIQAKIDRLVKGGSTKAIASVTLDSWYVVKGLRVVDGKKGLFVSMPQESYMDKGEKKYSNIFFPITNAAKMELQDAVLKAYDQYLDQQHETGHSAQWENQDDGILPFGM
ncbi:MAG: SpoVG family protein [Oscillospiraceae bacterium]|nr:SpoVG family protein [Oscillospiraceae bacterium]